MKARCRQSISKSALAVFSLLLTSMTSQLTAAIDVAGLNGQPNVIAVLRARGLLQVRVVPDSPSASA